MSAAAPVLFVSHETGCGGAELSLLDLLSGLDRDHHPPVLVTSGPGELATRAEALGVPVEFVPMQQRGVLGRLRQLPGAIRSLCALVARHRASFVHTNTLVAGYAGLAAARRTGIANVWHVRDMGYPALARAACLRSSAVIANSRATAAALRAPPRTAPLIHVVWNGVAPEFFAAEPRGLLRSELGLGDEALVVALVARCDPWKGHEDLLAAAALLAGTQRRVHFVFLGGQPLATGRTGADFATHLREEAARLRITDRVHFLGQRADVATLLRDVDVLAHPVREPEPFGRAIAEAFAAGKAVVASGIGGIRELVTDEVTGLWTPPRNPGALAAALGRLLEDAALRQKLGAAARAFANAHCTTAHHARQVETIYAGLSRR